MFKSILVGLVSLASLTSGQAQMVTGRVVSQTNGAPLSHVTVRLESQVGVTTTTDENGTFHLPLTAATSDAQLLISHLGYQAKALPLNRLGPTIALEESLYQIGEVVIRYERVRELLLKRWKIDEGSVVAVADNAIAELQQSDSLKAKKLLQNPGSLRAALKLARLVFLADGTVKTKFGPLGASAEWQLDEQEHTLRIVRKNGRNALMIVVELTANRLVVCESRLDRQPEVYIPAN